MLERQSADFLNALPLIYRNVHYLQQPISYWFYFLANKYERPGPKKVPVPKKDEKPIMGLVSDKNFIVSNAVENILAAPQLPTNNEKDFLKKKNYGKVPKYLQTIKKEIEDEYQLVREMQIEEEAEMDRQKFLMDENEKEEMIAALKKKWEVVHKEYQTLTHKNKLDTLGLKEKFESCERELKQLERDIEKLSKNYIFVDTTAPSSYFWNVWMIMQQIGAFCPHSCQPLIELVPVYTHSRSYRKPIFKLMRCLGTNLTFIN